MISWAAIRALPWRWIVAIALVVAGIAALWVVSGEFYRSGRNAADAGHADAALRQQSADVARGQLSSGQLAADERRIDDAEKSALGGLSAAGQRIDADSLRAIRDADAKTGGAAAR